MFIHPKLKRLLKAYRETPGIRHDLGKTKEIIAHYYGAKSRHRGNAAAGTATKNTKANPKDPFFRRGTKSQRRVNPRVLWRMAIRESFGC